MARNSLLRHSDKLAFSDYKLLKAHTSALPILTHTHPCLNPLSTKARYTFSKSLSHLFFYHSFFLSLSLSTSLSLSFFILTTFPFLSLHFPSSFPLFFYHFLKISHSFFFSLSLSLYISLSSFITFSKSLILSFSLSLHLFLSFFLTTFFLFHTHISPSLSLSTSPILLSLSHSIQFFGWKVIDQKWKMKIKVEFQIESIKFLTKMFPDKFGTICDIWTFQINFCAG